MNDNLIKKTILSLDRDPKSEPIAHVVGTVLLSDKLHLHIKCQACEHQDKYVALIVGIPINSDMPMKYVIQETAKEVGWRVCDDSVLCDECCTIINNIAW